MYLENLITDATQPQRLGRFWEAVLGGERLTDEPEGYETRLAIAGGLGDSTTTQRRSQRSSLTCR